TWDNSHPYQGPFHLGETAIVKAGIFEGRTLVSTLAEGNFRLVPKEREDAVKYSLHYGESLDKLPNFTSRPVKEGHVIEFSTRPILPDGDRQEQVALLLESYIDIQEGG